MSEPSAPQASDLGYVALPASGHGPGIIVIQEWWGLVGHIKSVADRFAAEGFVALAPDFYEGRSTTEPDEAGSLMMALNIDGAADLIRKSVDALLAMPETTGGKVGVVGFCMGGQLAMYAACLDSRIGACVNFYGIHPNIHPDFAKMQAPLLGHFAERDDYASPAQVAALSEHLYELRKPHEFIQYDGVDHAFFNDDRPAVFNGEAASRAWAKTLEFFRSQLN